MAVVVDTNVAIVASGHSPQADAECIDACVQRLHTIMQNGDLLIDTLGLILHEYTKKLGHAGQPGVGEKFVKWAFNNQATSESVRQVAITRQNKTGWRLFQEFPDRKDLMEFDADDQKFVAVSVSSNQNPPILNAVDSGWWIHEAALNAAGVPVEFVCPHLTFRKRRDHVQTR